MYFDGVASDGVMLLHVVYSYFTTQSIHQRNLLLGIQLSYIREMYERSMVNPVSLLEHLENKTVDLPISDNFVFLKGYNSLNLGSIHHLSAFAIWVLDFGAYLIRLLYLQATASPETESYGIFYSNSRPIRMDDFTSPVVQFHFARKCNLDELVSQRHPNF